MRVVLADVEPDALDRAVKELAGDGHEVHGVVCDVADAESVEACAHEALGRFGAINVVCNNAGVGGNEHAPSWATPAREWEWVLGVNLMGVIHGMTAFVPHVLEAGEGHVVNTASMAGLAALPDMAPYSVSKHGVVALSEAARHELRAAGANVGVSVLCPGFVRTRIMDSARNRPARYGGPIGTSAQPTAELMNAFVDAGTDPGDVARQVVDAIRADRFWVLTHPDFLPTLRDRYDRLLAGENPAPPF
jgi:NAD(P)-dependent dehydrogenase (short-subunit alcohol dehydrogenase family)